MPEAAASDIGGWRTIEELAALVGAYCWLEQRIFEVTGAWATSAGSVDRVDAGLRVWSAATSRRHGALAGRWAERLPVRAGVDAPALITAPAEPAGLDGVFEELAATKELVAGVSALVKTVLPWVGGVYGSHLSIAAPVTEASVMEVLVEARREGAMEIKGGRAILGVLLADGTPSGHVGEAVKQVFALVHVSPAVRPG